MRTETAIGVLFGLLAVLFLILSARVRPPSPGLVHPARKAFLRAALMFSVAAAVLLLRAHWK